MNRPFNLCRKTGLIYLLIVLLLGLSAQLALAQTGDPPLSVEEREALLRQAVTTAFEQADSRPFQVGAVKIVDDWALVSFRVEPVEASGWAVHLGLAHWQEADWQVALEGSGLFLTWLDQLPEALIPLESRDYLNPTVSIAADAPGLWLPFPVGQTWKYLAGPHGSLGREAVDFGPFGPFDRNQPNPPPTAPLTGRERDVTAAAAGVVVDWDQNLLIIRHSSHPAWETGYYSLAAATNNHQLGQYIYQGQYIGAASTEGTHRQQDYLHFWVRRDGLDQGITGQILADWQIYQDNGYEVGQGRGRIVYRSGLDRIDCDTVESARLAPEQCHVNHGLAVPDPLPLVSITIQPSPTITVPVGSREFSRIGVEEANNLYRVKLRLTYGPANRVEVVDAYPGTPGIQVAPGDVFDSRPFTILRNEVDLAAGVIDFEAELQPPARAFNGIGSLVEITWQRQAAGQVELALTEIELADPNGRTIPAEAPDPLQVIVSGFSLAGEVELQGRTNWQGALIAAGKYQAQTQTNGQFNLGVAGLEPLLVTAPGYLSAQAQHPQESQPAEGETLYLGRITLPAGDVNADDQVDILDLAFIAGHYGSATAEADLNGDGAVNILDLALTAANYGQQGPVTGWR